MNERTILAPTIERGRRCQNCTHWSNGEMAIQHYKLRRHADLDAAAKRITEQGGPLTAGLGVRRLIDSDPHSLHKQRVGGKDRQTRDFSGLDARMQALGINYELGDTLMRSGRMGICLINAAPGDFVEFAYLCDKWTQRERPDGADKPDELPGEAKDRLGYDK